MSARATAQRRPRIDLQAFVHLTEIADYFVAFTIRAVAELGIADELQRGARSVEELAERTETHAPSLYRALRALACKGVFTEVAPRRFALTPLADLLRSDHPLSLRDAYRLMPADVAAWTHFDHSLRTGQPAFDHVFGAPFFDFLTTHPDEGATFNGGMAAFSELENPHIAAAYDFPPGARVVDVGGGRGGFIAEVLRAHPSVRGVLYDLPEVVRDAAYLRAGAVAGRCDILAGSFFENVPNGADVYVVKRILHDWSDETCVRILANIRRAMPAGSRVLAIDAVLAPRGTSDMNKVSDLVMMVVCPGRERTEQEFDDLFAAAGIRLTRVVLTPSSLSIVEGVTT